jgi:hypothetical protein
MGRPNMRVQRTRVLLPAVARRSPLTRRPLGGARWFTALLLVMAVTRCATQSASTPPPLDLHGSGIETLSGDWSGVFEVRRVGSCTVEHGESTTAPFRARLTIEQDGAFELRGYEADGTQSKTPAAVGVFDRELRASALRSFVSKCPSGPSETKTKLEGRVHEGPDGPTLELSGRETGCPKEHCVFSLHFRLVRGRQ